MTGAFLTPREYITWETGGMSGQEEIDFFQKLIDMKIIGTLSSRYQRRAAELQAAGQVEDYEAA
jgi:hypothetical protein